MGIAFSPRLNFGLCSNPSSNPPPFSTIFQSDQNGSSRPRNKINVREKSNKSSKRSKGFLKLSISGTEKRRGGGQRPVVNLKELNGFLKYQHFKMEGIHLVKDRI